MVLTKLINVLWFSPSVQLFSSLFALIVLVTKAIYNLWACRLHTQFGVHALYEGVLVSPAIAAIYTNFIHEIEHTLCTTLVISIGMQQRILALHHCDDMSNAGLHCFNYCPGYWPGPSPS